ncbi:MAG: NADPH-dependent glutamate synthase, partial [Bacteroidaceae bacterium]|nr:NADPH-dependent glutamate synthase [Bacteroidaceae bacterium]
NTIMVDGTGMCGACRITVGGKTKFVCVDGPEFDGHQVDFDEMFKRMGSFKDVEREEMSHLEQHVCKVEPQAEVQNSELNTQNSELNQTPMEVLLDRKAPWREELRKAMKPKERTAIHRCPMNELDPVYRATTRTEEVNTGYTKEQAMTEAKRCLDCANPTCMQGCPVSINIPSFIKNVERGEFLEAARVLKHTSALPAVCGRVCPQEKQCESQCMHLKMNEPAVAIGNLERFVADYERESGNIALPEIAPSNGIKVAVVGSGPAGLSFAGDMVKLGYDVTVFEALHEIGGVLKYGIPEFRLPNKIVDVEINNLEKMGVNFVKDCIVGKTISVEELQEEGYKGIFVASGAGLPNFMNIPGENSVNIMSSNEYLTRVNLMDASNPDTDTPINPAKSVMVVGGGNTAMDSCRTAKRLGAEKVFIVYRRSEAEMPARLEEVKHAKEEGIVFLTLHNPLEYIADEQGKVKQVVLQKMELGEPDASGRRSPVAIPGATVTLDIDMAVVAVGVSPNPIVPTSIKGLELGRKNTIAVNEKMQSSIPTIFAGGDIVRGGATVILAMGDGRKAAASMHEELSK